MKITHLLFLSTLLATLSSCAVSTEKMKKETANYNLPVKAQKDKALVYVVRPSNMGGLIKFNVFLDDKERDSEMGFNTGNKYIYFFVSPGKHKIFSKAENWADVEIDAKDNEQIFVKQNTSMGFIMARNSLEIVPELEGKYYVKNAKKGVVRKTERHLSGE